MQSSVSVRQSGINGLGVFADKPFLPGDAILEIDDSRVVDGRHPLADGDEARHCDYLGGGRVVLMQYPERHINHSCDPNTYTKTIGGRRVVIALRAIPAGKEITYDYCINGDGDTVWNCNCGTARCRKKIHSDFFHLPLDLQRKYLPLLDSWFREEKHAEIASLQARLGKQ